MSFDLNAALAFKPELDRERVAVPGLGECWLYELSGEERDSFESSVVGPDGERDLSNIRAKLLVRAIRDDNGRRIFHDAHAENVGRWPARLLLPLFEKAQKLSRIGANDIEELQGNSGGGPNE